MKRLLLISSLSLFIVSMLLASTKDPVAVLFQVKGKVEYSKDGATWKVVRRNKFLFEGYQLRSAEDGSGRINDRKSGQSLLLKPETLLTVTSDGLKIEAGLVTESDDSNPLLTALIRRFTKSQSHTTVRRSAESNKPELTLVRHLVLTEEYPYLVWENIDPFSEYRLYIGKDLYQIPRSDNQYIRVKVKPFKATQEVSIEALKDNEVYTALKPYKYRGASKTQTVQWLSEEEKMEFTHAMDRIKAAYPDNRFLLGSFFEKEEMWVAAMDQYRMHLQENPDDIEMTPFLFRVYKKLNLRGIYSRELKRWTQAMKQ